MKLRHIIMSLSLLSLLSACSENKDGSAAEQDIQPMIPVSTLSNQNVKAIAEDSLGQVWIGTFRGLNRYSTNGFQQFFCTGDSLDLPDDQITCLYKDSHKRFWVGTIHGAAMLNDCDKFERIPINQQNDCGYQFFEDSTGKVYLNLKNSLARFNEDKRMFEVQVPDLYPSYAIHSNAFTDHNDDVWMVNSLCLRRYDKESFALLDSIPLNDYIVCSNYDKDRGTLWMSGYKNLRRFERRRFLTTPSGVVSHPLYHKAQITHIAPYSHNQLLISTFNHGMFIYDSLDDRMIDASDSDFPFNPPSMRITQIFSDSWGNIWFGSLDQGYSVCNTSSQNFNTVNRLNDAFKGKSVMSVDCDKKGHLWIVTMMDGVFYYDFTNARLIKVDTGDVSGIHDLQFNSITSVFVDSNDNVWLALLQANKLICGTFDAATGKYSASASFDITAPHCIVEDNKGTIYVGMGIPKVAIKKKGDNEFTEIPSNTLGFGFVSSIEPMQDGSVMIGTLMSPLTQYNPYTLKYDDVNIDKAQWESCLLRGSYIPTDLHLDSDRNLWIGTVGNGVLKYSPSTGDVVRVPGAPCTDISTFIEDLQGNIWISTQYGLGRIDHNTLKCTNLYANDGIGGNQFNDRAGCMLPDGRLVFGGTHGITIFDPLAIVESNTISPVFQDLKIHNKVISPVEHPEVIKCSLFKCPDVNLNHTQNAFSISFAVLDNSAEGKVRYQYLLDGHDPQWVDARNTSEAYYGNLKAGKYTFRVRTVGADGQPDAGSEISLRITIKPAPWLSWWAIVGYILILSLVIYEILRHRHHYLEEKEKVRLANLEKEQEKRINTMNMSFFANVSHEFRTPLTMISAPLTQLQDDESLKPSHRQLLAIVQHSVSRMLKLVNQLLDFNKLENDTLRLQVSENDIAATLRHQTELFSINAAEKNINLSVSGIEAPLIVYIDTDKIEKIVSNMLSNAIKFTPAGGHITLSLDVFNGLIHIIVSDSGPGIPDDQLEKIFERYYQLNNQSTGTYNYGSGIGLYYARALATLHHGSLKATNNETSGAIFTLTIPATDIYLLSEHSETQNNTFVNGSTDCLDNEDDASETNHELTILVVDDDPEVVRYLKFLLSPRYNVITCFSADDAFQKATETHPDLIISDVVMPDMNGYNLTRKIKDDLHLCHIPVILITAKSTVDNQVEGLNSGADAYVTKPFDPNYVLALVQSQLANREKVRHLLAKSTEINENPTDNSTELSPLDRAFMNDLYALMENELSNIELDINRISEMLHISRTKLYYKIKGLTGTNPGAFFKTYKLNRAIQLLKTGKYTISEIADMTGFSTLSHFSSSFKKQFGTSPSEYIKS